MSCSQYDIPTSQNIDPQANLPAGGVHVPLRLMSTPAAAASHGLL
jgi:hypothetical protein